MWKRVAVVASFLLWFAVVAGPNLLTAKNRTRQKRTMADMRSIATAWEARAVDLKSYNVGPPDRARIALDDLERALSPTYIKALPRRDGWGTEFVVGIGACDRTCSTQSYSIRSYAGDRQPDSEHYADNVTTNFAEDLVFADGTFTRYPEGI